MKLSPPRLLLHLEGLAVLAGGCLVYSHFGYSWTRFAIFLLAPDLAMLAFLAGRKPGVLAYNAVHTYVAPFLVFALLSALDRPSAFWIPLIWTAHIGLDRLLGYGLKYPADLKQTHLQRA